MEEIWLKKKNRPKRINLKKPSGKKILGDLYEEYFKAIKALDSPDPVDIFKEILNKKI